MNRKEFIKSGGAAALLLSLGISLESCSSSEDPTPANQNSNGNSGTATGTGSNPNVVEFSLSDSPFDILNTNDAWLLHPSQSVLLVNVAGTIRAFTSICTHSGCSDQWSFNGNFTCNCHGSVFNRAGQVVNGPATSPLREFDVTVDGNNISIDIS